MVPLTIIRFWQTPLNSNPIEKGVTNVQVRDMRDSAWRSFGRWLLEEDWAEELDAPTCKRDLQAAIHLLLPWKTVKVQCTDRPWITNKLKTLIRKRQEAFNRALWQRFWYLVSTSPLEITDLGKHPREESHRARSWACCCLPL